jgi:hypothetical protein
MFFAVLYGSSGIVCTIGSATIFNFLLWAINHSRYVDPQPLSTIGFLMKFSEYAPLPKILDGPEMF